MKKLLIMVGMYVILYNAKAQSPLWWKLDGSNSGTSSTAIGVSNAESLRLKTNGTVWLSISPTGEYYFHSLSDATEGLLGIKQDGRVARINFTGNANDVFRGNGTFASVSSLTGWNLTGSSLITSYNVGIGTTTPPSEKLVVDGNILATGSISGTSLNVIDIITSGREFKISTSLHMMGKNVNDPNSKNEICGLNGDLYIQCENNNNYNTIFNYGNGSKVGFGVLPTEEFHVGKKARFDESVYINKILPATDSIITFGENTIHFNTYNNNIWGSAIGSNNINGIGLGSPNTFGTGFRSVAIGNKVRASANNSVVIGSTDATSSQLNNTIPNSLMIGFNSDIPTITVLPASGNGTVGHVGIGTTCVPTDYLLAINGKVIMEEGTIKLSDAGGCWPDFVFEESYKRMEWQVKSEYLKNYKHLPYLPSALKIESDGLDLGSGLAAITQNVEENTLDIIDLYKEVKRLNEELERLKQENERLKKEEPKN